MKKRIITAAVLIPGFVALLLLASSEVIAVTVAIVSVMGLIEFYKTVGLTKSKTLCISGCIIGAIIPLLEVARKWLTLPVLTKDITVLVLYVAMLVMFAAMLIGHKKVGAADVGLLIFSEIYIPIFLNNITYIREMEFGRFLIWLVFIGAFLTDSSAYFVGIFLGKHKLCPEISPKKTIEGAIGGVAGCILFFIVYGLLVKYAFMIDVSFVKLGILGFISAIISEIGDLVASVIKRHYGIKDYGNLFPGHGGILDRCDSVILVSPIIYLFLNTVGIM